LLPLTNCSEAWDCKRVGSALYTLLKFHVIFHQYAMVKLTRTVVTPSVGVTLSELKGSGPNAAACDLRGKGHSGSPCLGHLLLSLRSLSSASKTNPHKT
ncbi:hypothetical protein BIS07_20875, partial [Halomonas sp. FL8]|uniref:hypothetical protein n=1 Tax=Halomonas sp. FL8 TaxID=1904461 RepID=UPI00209C8246